MRAKSGNQNERNCRVLEEVHVKKSLQIQGSKEREREEERERESERERRDEREKKKIARFLRSCPFFVSQQNLSHQSAHKKFNCHT